MRCAALGIPECCGLESLRSPLLAGRDRLTILLGRLRENEPGAPIACPRSDPQIEGVAMTNVPTRALAAVVAVALLAGCSGTGSEGASPTPSDAAATTAGPSASATSTLSAEQQRAFEEATEVVLAYRQTITDLYSGARTNLNDLNEVATGDLLDQGLKNIQEGLTQGWRYEPKGARVAISAARPLRVDLARNPNTVVVRACLDATAVTAISPNGTPDEGVREELDYTVVRARHLPAGWAVSRVEGEDNPEDRRC